MVQLGIDLSRSQREQARARVLTGPCLVLLLSVCPLEGCGTNPRSVTRYMEELEGRVSALEEQNQDLMERLGTTQEAPAASSMFIATNMTLRVPSEYSTIQSALELLDAYTIASTATVKIQVVSDITLTETLSIRHRDGARIWIEGYLNPTLTFEGAGAAIQITDGYSLGGFGGLHLMGPVVHTDATQGLAVSRGGTVACTEQLEISGFDVGVAALYGGIAICNDANIHSNGVGVTAVYGGVVSANGSTIVEHSDAGIRVSYGGLFQADRLHVEDAPIGLAAMYGGLATVSNSTVIGIDNQALLAHVQSLLTAANITTEGGTAAEASAGSFVAASGAFSGGSYCALATMDASVAIPNGSCISGTMSPSEPGNGYDENAIYR